MSFVQRKDAETQRRKGRKAFNGKYAGAALAAMTEKEKLCVSAVRDHR